MGHRQDKRRGSSNPSLRKRRDATDRSVLCEKKIQAWDFDLYADATDNTPKRQGRWQEGKDSLASLGAADVSSPPSESRVRRRLASCADRTVKGASEKRESRVGWRHRSSWSGWWKKKKKERHDSCEDLLPVAVKRASSASRPERVLPILPCSYFGTPGGFGCVATRVRWWTSVLTMIATTQVRTGTRKKKKRGGLLNVYESWPTLTQGLEKRARPTGGVFRHGPQDSRCRTGRGCTCFCCTSGPSRRASAARPNAHRRLGPKDACFPA